MFDIRKVKADISFHRKYSQSNRNKSINNAITLISLLLCMAFFFEMRDLLLVLCCKIKERGVLCLTLNKS